MLKKTSVTITLILFLLVFLAAVTNAAEVRKSTEYSEQLPARINLLEDGSDPGIYGGGSLYLGPSYSYARGMRRICDNEYTQRDYQHNTAQGRQIFYAGYKNAGCDYVLFDWTYTGPPGSINVIRYALFDWGGTHDWDFEFECCGATISPNNSRYCNLDFSADSNSAVVCYHYSADAVSPIYSMVGYNRDGCRFCNFDEDTLPPAPNTEAPPGTDTINTGYCGDFDVQNSPYIWPKVDVDSTADGFVVTHVAAHEAGCGEPTVPETAIETTSNIYYRKVANALNQPWTGTWEGPYFMDSVYVISQLVRADRRPDSPYVYYCYLKPIYYYTGSTHPCEASGLGHYQQTNEIVYRKSSDDGATWGPIQYVTDYASTFELNGTDPAGTDLTAMVDTSGCLHMAWVSSNRDPENNCAIYYACKLWHWDNCNNCISLAYDGTHPRLFVGDLGNWNLPIYNINISYCESGGADRYYITFDRFGAHPVGDTSFEVGAGPTGADTLYQCADILCVASDNTGGKGKTWTDAVNLTNTDNTDCTPGQCFSETYPTMALYLIDSLMIEYIEDKDCGQWLVGEGAQTDNPVMFLTWPCFAMADVEANCNYSTVPDPPVWEEVAVKHTDSTDCTVEETYTDSVVISNSGNVEIVYSTSSDVTWLTVTAGDEDTVSAGTGPRGSDDPSWDGDPGCAQPKTIVWQASSAGLPVGNYTGNITVDIESAECEDFDIEVNLVVTCKYFLPEWARIQGGCWTVDVWNVPQAGHQDQEDFAGNMQFYTCGGDSTIHPLYNNALIVGWNDGAKAFSMMMGDEEEDNYNAQMRALDSIVVTEVGNPSGGSGYYKASGKWCTEDSSIYGTAEYYVPGNQDTSCLIEKFTIWNESGAAISDFLVGEGTDWDIRTDSNYDDCDFDPAHLMLYQTGCRGNTDVFAGVAPHCGYDQLIGGATLDNHDFIYPHVGYNPDSIYDKLNSLDGTFELFKDSCTDLNMAYRFWEGTLGVDDTLTVCKIKAVSANSYAELQEYIEKAYIFIVDWNLCCQPPVYAGTNKDNQDDYVPTDGDPTGTVWHELWPDYCEEYEVAEWIDNGDGILSYCDTLISVNTAVPEDTVIEHVKRVTTTITVTLEQDTLYFDYLSYNPYNSDLDTNHLVNGWWNQVHPNNDTIGLQCTDYTSANNAILDAGDLITIGGVEYIIIEVATDIITEIVVSCQGICGNANNQGGVNVADAVWIINFVFAGGDPPQPVLACGNANGQGGVNVADAVWIINFVFAGGDPPGDCDPGNPLWTDGDCCPFTP